MFVDVIMSLGTLFLLVCVQTECKVNFRRAVIAYSQKKDAKGVENVQSSVKKLLL